jgi:small-conductance mechanosensitive channel
VGIGFGLQKITSNFISGLILLFEKSVEEGDLIELNDGTVGFVRNTGARYTLVETFDSKDIMVPNEDFITNRVTNWTFKNSSARVETRISVAYDSDVEAVRNLILSTALEHNRCCSDPAPQCHLDAYGADGLEFVLYFWVADVTLGRMDVKSDILRALWQKFKAQGIVIPFPQRDIHVTHIGEPQKRP